MSWTWGLLIVVVVYLAANLIVRRLGLFSSGLDGESLRERLSGKRGTICLVDVRSPEEYASGHIPAALSIPHYAIAQTPPPVAKETLVVLYCQTGSRSIVARSQLRRLGYTNVVNFGPLRRWRGELIRGRSPGLLSSTDAPKDRPAQ